MSQSSAAATPERRMQATVGSMPAAIGELVFPRRCPVCGGTADLFDQPWCDACADQVCLWECAICPVCRRYRRAGRSACTQGHEAACLHSVYVLGGYDDAFAAVIHALKYSGARVLARPLARCLARFVTAHMRHDLVVAVPTSKRKLQERGFGHAEEIARHLAGEIALPCSGGLYQARKTADQTRLSAGARRENLHEAFAVRDPEAICGKRILVVDDVMTTGATLGEAARALSAAGAETVVGAIVALNIRGVGVDAMSSRGRI